MNKPAIDYFNDRAEDLARQYNALDREKVHQDLLARLPTGVALRVLDVGAGSGADAAMFADRGYHVVAAEPADTLRQTGEVAFKDKGIIWTPEALPAFGAAVTSSAPYDVITSVGVVQYLDKKDRVKSLKNMFSMLAKGGHVEIQYPTPASREHQFTIDRNEILKILEVFNKKAVASDRLDVVIDKLIPDFSGRKALDGSDLFFHTLVLQRCP